MADGGYTITPDPEARPTAYSDDQLALAFSARHDGQLLYVPTWGYWLQWDGTRWCRDDKLWVYDLARIICREFAAQAADNGEKKAISKALTSATTVSAVERLARSDTRHARSSDTFDADPWALNTPAGVLDLRTGDIRSHHRGDLFTKVTSVAPIGPCRRWIRFLIQVTRGDRKLIRYFQRFIGYTLTGLTREHAFLFLWGPGGNGKSVLLSTVAAMLGDYATTAMADVFTVGRSEQHPTHIATLRGARMVVVSETEEGRPWAESRIKALTGGDRMTARIMRGDPFEFSPEFKLWIAGNHRPMLRNPDPAMRRRLNLVPMTFVPSRPDKTLLEALKGELPGILAWAVRGCLEWQKQGLNPPPVILEASADYFAEQDSLAAWLEERCEAKDLSEAPARALFQDWKRWMTERSEDPGTEKRFSEKLEGYAAKKRTNKGIMFLGLKLLASDTGIW